MYNILDTEDRLLIPVPELIDSDVQFIINPMSKKFYMGFVDDLEAQFDVTVHGCVIHCSKDTALQILLRFA